MGLTSPNQSSQLARVAWAEYFAPEHGAADRAAAMSVGAFARARGVLTGTIAPLPLRQFEGETEVDAPWLYRTSGTQPLWHRMAWTIDDLLFHGWSLWTVERDSSGQIVDAQRIPREWWSYNDYTGVIQINFKPVDPRSVILFPGPFEGVLAVAENTIRQSRALDRARYARAANPIPLVHAAPANTDDEVTDEEMDAMSAAIADALSKVNAGLVTDGKWKLEALGSNSIDMFEKARNDIVLDASRFSGVNASILDGSQSTASLTYSTQEGKRNEFLDFALQYWTGPIEARLSMDDVCPPGQRIRFDLSSLITTEQAPVAAPTED